MTRGKVIGAYVGTLHDVGEEEQISFFGVMYRMHEGGYVGRSLHVYFQTGLSSPSLYCRHVEYRRLRNMYLFETRGMQEEKQESGGPMRA